MTFDYCARTGDDAIPMKLQPFYVVDSERAIFDDSLAGNSNPLTDYAGIRDC